MTEREVATPIEKNLEEIRTEANVILKIVDQYIKAGCLDDAKEHLEKAKLIDPTNAYIYAFQERISFLKDEASKKNLAIAHHKSFEDAARAKLDSDRRRAEEERQKKETEERQKEDAKKIDGWLQKKAENDRKQQQELIRAASGLPARESVPVAKTPTPVSPTPPVPLVPPVLIVPPAPIIPPVSPDLKRTTESIPVQNPKQTTIPSGGPAVKQADQAHDMYKRVLLLAWADGAISPEEESQLRDLRTTLRITAAEHTQLELEAKEESYTHAFTLVWTSSMNLKERSAVINELRHKYQISSEAHSRIESKILTDFGQHENKPTLYIIDDDENTLDMIIRVLEGAGFAVKAFNTSDEALVGLKNDLPDLIVSDINLETSTIGGFSFYENVRKLQHLSHVPFIFLSGMTDEGMVRYGKGLGADDYITKPFSGEMLVDTIKGKLKRYKQMKTQLG